MCKTVKKTLLAKRYSVKSPSLTWEYYKGGILSTSNSIKNIFACMISGLEISIISEVGFRLLLLFSNSKTNPDIFSGMFSKPTFNY